MVSSSVGIFNYTQKTGLRNIYLRLPGPEGFGHRPKQMPPLMNHVPARVRALHKMDGVPHICAASELPIFPLLIEILMCV